MDFETKGNGGNRENYTERSISAQSSSRYEEEEREIVEKVEET